MAINIPSLFRDVIETPEQRQRRKLSEAVALAPQARGGIASLLNPLAQATSINLQQGSEGLGRSVGGMLGLDMRDTSQKVSDELLGADLSSSTGMRDLSKAINRYAPAQAIGLLQAADEREQAEAAAEAAAIKSQNEAYLTQLKTINELNQARTQQETELQRIAAEQLEQTRTESLRSGLKNMVTTRLSALGPSNELQSYLQRIDGGQYDSVDGAKLLLQEINPEDDIISAGGSTLFNKTTGEFIIPPKTDPLSGYVLEPNVKDFDPGSIGRYNIANRKIESDNTLTDQAKFDAIQNNSLILKPSIPEHKYVPVTRTVNDESITEYIAVPTGKLVGETQDKVDALNSRRRAGLGNANAGLTSAKRIREQINAAEEKGEGITGGFVDVAFSYVAGKPQYELRLNLEQLEGIMGLTGLSEARLGSATGASGFGALSAPELRLLQDRVAALRVGQGYEEFMESLNLVEQSLTEMAKNNSQTITYNQYVGLEPRPDVLDFSNDEI